MRTTIIIFLLFTFYFCRSRDSEVEVIKQFNSCIQAVNEYDLYEGEITDSILAKFYFSTEYLTDLTQIKATYIFADVPYYHSRQDCLNDIKHWRKWFHKNKNTITKSYSDSLILQILQKNIWWQYDSDKSYFPE